MTELEVLRGARKRIEREEDWCQGRAGMGHRRCLMGACVTAGGAWVDGATRTPFWNGGVGESVGRLLIERTGPEHPSDFNDSHTHAEVLSLMDDVIATLEEREYGSPLSEDPGGLVTVTTEARASQEEAVGVL